MPFATGARITLENRGDRAARRRAAGALVPRRLRGRTTRRCPTTCCASTRSGARSARRRRSVRSRTCSCTARVNLDGAENYVALDSRRRGADGRASCSRSTTPHGGWFGEGDDMVFVDGDAWPPSIHGTGTEEIFGGGACPTTRVRRPVPRLPPDRVARTTPGSSAMYRWFVHDPIRFTTEPALDGRARSREQLRERVRVGRVLVPDASRTAVPRAARARRDAAAAVRRLRRGARERLMAAAREADRREPRGQPVAVRPAGPHRRAASTAATTRASSRSCRGTALF